MDRGIRVAVRLTPRAGRNRIDGIALDAEGRAVLKVAVAEAPERGRANAALIRLLAKAWRVPRNALSITAGVSDRRKTVFIAGDPSALMNQLTERIGGEDG